MVTLTDSHIETFKIPLNKYTKPIYITELKIEAWGWWVYIVQIYFKFRTASQFIW